MTNLDYKTGVIHSPFSLENEDLYNRWRDQKLKDYPKNLGDLLVEINAGRFK